MFTIIVPIFGRTVHLLQLNSHHSASYAIELTANFIFEGVYERKLTGRKQDRALFRVTQRFLSSLRDAIDRLQMKHLFWSHAIGEIPDGSPYLLFWRTSGVTFCVQNVAVECRSYLSYPILDVFKRSRYALERELSESVLRRQQNKHG